MALHKMYDLKLVRLKLHRSVSDKNMEEYRRLKERSLKLYNPVLPTILSNTPTTSSITKRTNIELMLPKPALLLIDASCLEKALKVFFPMKLASEDMSLLLTAMINSLEKAYHVNFRKRIMHESTATGQPSSLGNLCLNLPHQPIKVVTHQMKVQSGKAVNKHTLEPSQTSGTAALLVESGVDVSLSMDLLRHTEAPCMSQRQSCCEIAVVLTCRPELYEALEMASGRSHIKAIYVCGLPKELLASPLEKMVKRIPEEVNLRLILNCAAEALLASSPGGNNKQKIRNDCPQWKQCGYVLPLPPTSLSSTTQHTQQALLPLTTEKLGHLQTFNHPCAHGGKCQIQAPYHQQAWSHGNSGASCTERTNNAKACETVATSKKASFNPCQRLRGEIFEMDDEEEESDEEWLQELYLLRRNSFPGLYAEIDPEEEQGNPLSQEEIGETMFSISL